MGDLGGRHGGGSRRQPWHVTGEGRRASPMCVTVGSIGGVSPEPGALRSSRVGGGDGTRTGSLPDWPGHAWERVPLQLFSAPETYLSHRQTASPSPSSEFGHEGKAGRKSADGTARWGSHARRNSGNGGGTEPIFATHKTRAWASKLETPRQGLGPGDHEFGPTLSRHPCARTATRAGFPKSFRRSMRRRGLLPQRWPSQAL